MGVEQNLSYNDSVGFVEKDGFFLLRYKEKVYKEVKDSPQPTEITIDSSAYGWHWILESPKNHNYNSSFDKLFGLKVFPNKSKIIYVMRWEFTENDRKPELYKTYIYDVDKKENREIFSYKWSSNGDEYPVTLIGKFSTDSNFISFNNIDCFECEHINGITILYDVNRNISKNIGEVIDFSWLDNGNYQYKDYIEVKCPETDLIPRICNEKSENLPLKHGQFL